MGHPFGDLIRQHLSRSHGLSQNKLAAGIDQDPAVISAMCRGRRLTGSQARERVLAIIRWFREQEVLDNVAEANDLLEVAGLSRLDPACPDEAEIVRSLRVVSQPGGKDERRLYDPRVRGQGLTRRTIILAAVALIATGLLVAIGSAILTGMQSKQPSWEEDFDPLDPDRWLHQQTSAVWEDIPGPMAVLRENHPDQDYGKVESAIIAVDVDAYPILRVHVAAIDPDASCTIQILDKRTESWRDVLPKITYPDEYTVDLTRAMDWHGPQVFTINVWIGGEAKTVTFDRIRIEPRAAAPAD